MKRTIFIAASAAMAAGAAAIPASAAVPGGSELVETSAQFDLASFARIVDRPAQIRYVVEQIAFKPTLWNNLKNALNGLQFGYGYPAGEITLALAGHGASAAYGYSDYVWKKYRIGDFFKIKDANGAAVESNIWYPEKTAFDPKVSPDNEAGMYQDTSIQMLQRRGLIVLTCHTAVEEQSRKLVKGGFVPAGMTAQDVANDILTHLIPGALVNPSMVATVAVLQKRYGYSYAAFTF